VPGNRRAMRGHRWEPRTERPSGLVAPVRLDPAGVLGPTPKQARGPGWKQSAHGWYVPACVDREVVEQRILEQAARLPSNGAVTAWASLRWRGAAFFDGTEQGGRIVLPVPLLGNIRSDDRVQVSKAQLAPEDRAVIDGIACTTATRALFDEMVRRGRLRPAVVAVDMAVAAGLVSIDEITTYVHTRPAWTGVPLCRNAVVLAIDHSRSPQESRMRLIWILDAELPPPLCNRAVFNLDGRLLGYPDLFDPVAGVVGEYAGADHRDPERHRADVVREELFRDHGLECFTVVGEDMHDHSLVAGRMLSARRRAKFLPPESCAWTLDPPPGWTGSLYR
jgi:hypothetical protein